MMPKIWIKYSTQMLTRLRDDKRGTSIIELALMAPIGISLIIAVADISLAYVNQLALEQSAQRAIEMVTARGNDRGDFAFVKNEAESMSNVETATVSKWLECNNVKQAFDVTACLSGQTAATYVKIEVTGTFEPLFPNNPMWSAKITQDKKIPITADAVVRAS